MTGFIKENIPTQTPMVPHDFRHAMCFGETGSGKTSSYLLPNIKSRLERGHGMFIIDYKGSLHSQVKMLAKGAGRLQDVIEIGSPWAESFNVLKGVKKSLFLKAVSKLNGEDKERFWITSSLNVIGMLYSVLTLLEHLSEIGGAFNENSVPEYVLNVTSFIEITQSKDDFETFCKRVDEYLFGFRLIALVRMKEEVPQRTILLINQFVQKISDTLKSIKWFLSDIDEDKPSSGSGGVLFMVRNLLLTFNERGFCGTDDMLQMLDEGKVIVLRTDMFDHNQTEALMHILYTRLAKRIDTDRPVSLFIDEFQRSVGKESLPFIDVFREKRVELIAAMQNRSQLENKIGEQETDAFLGNIIHRYHYANHLENGLKVFEYTSNGRRYMAEPFFFDNAALDRAQLAWQESKGIEIELRGKWVYEEQIDEHTSLVRNIRTGKRKRYFELCETDEKLLGLLTAHEGIEPSGPSGAAGDKSEKKRRDIEEILAALQEA